MSEQEIYLLLTDTACIPETPNYDLTKKAETIDINRF